MLCVPIIFALLTPFQSTLLERIDQQQQEGTICSQDISKLSLTWNQTARDHKLKSSILSWISPLEMAQIHQFTSDRAEKGSGRWLLTSEVFKTWQEGDHKLLWCWGIRM